MADSKPLVRRLYFRYLENGALLRYVCSQAWRLTRTGRAAECRFELYRFRSKFAHRILGDDNMNFANKVLAAFCLVLLFSTLAVSQMPFEAAGVTRLNVDESMNGWKPVCVLPTCNPGGRGIPSKTFQTIGHSSPSKDSGSMEVSITGPQYSNALWTYIAGVDDNATSFSMSLWVYPTGKTSAAGSYEFDQFDFSKSTGIEFMWGSQCNQGNGLWQIFDQLHGRWINIKVACSLAPNHWHQVRWDVHRVTGDTNRCSGKPCMYYDTLTVDGHVNPVNAVYPAGSLPNGWSSAVGFQVQIDIGPTGSGVTIDEYVDLADFWAM